MVIIPTKHLDEPRYILIAMLDNKYWSVVFTIRNENIRITIEYYIFSNLNILSCHQSKTKLFPPISVTVELLKNISSFQQKGDYAFVHKNIINISEQEIHILHCICLLFSSMPIC